MAPWFNIVWQHLFNIFIFRTFSPFFHDLIMSLITSHYIDQSEKFSLVLFPYFDNHQSSSSSHVPTHDIRLWQPTPHCPIAPLAKTIHCILPLCPPHPPWQASASRVPVLWAYVWVPIRSPGVMRARGHACLHCRANAEGKRTFTHASISGNPLSSM